MSDVKMCDNCSTIFSVNSEDWTTFRGSRRRRDPVTRDFITQEVMQDFCPKCSNRTFRGESKQINGTVPDDTE